MAAATPFLMFQGNAQAAMDLYVATFPDSRIVRADEIWESVEAHQASVKNIASGDFVEIMKMLAERPKGTYFSG